MQTNLKSTKNSNAPTRASSQLRAKEKKDVTQKTLDFLMNENQELKTKMNDLEIGHIKDREKLVRIFLPEFAIRPII